MMSVTNCIIVLNLNDVWMFSNDSPRVELLLFVFCFVFFFLRGGQGLVMFFQGFSHG